MICIPPKDNEFSVMNVFNAYTGENLGQIENIKKANMIVESETNNQRDEHDKVLRLSNDHTYELTFNACKLIEIEKFYKLFGIDMTNQSDAYDVRFIKLVQARKHKKRRINKKWLKRYGYKQMIVESKGWKVRTDTDNNVEFIKDGNTL